MRHPGRLTAEATVGHWFATVVAVLLASPTGL